MPNRHLRQIPGRKKATDEELIDAYFNRHMFLNQIRLYYKVGTLRLRKVVREHEQEMQHA